MRIVVRQPSRTTQEVIMRFTIIEDTPTDLIAPRGRHNA